MPVHFYAPFAAAAAWGALQDCESDNGGGTPKASRDDGDEDDAGENDEHDANLSPPSSTRNRRIIGHGVYHSQLGVELNSDNNSLFHTYDEHNIHNNNPNNNNKNNHGGPMIMTPHANNTPDATAYPYTTVNCHCLMDNAIEDQDDDNLLPNPSIQHSTSTFGDGLGTMLSFHELQQQQQSPNGNNANAIKLIQSCPTYATQQQQQHKNQQKSVVLRRGSSQFSSGATMNGHGSTNLWSSCDPILTGFVDGDFAAGKVRDIPVDGCFVISYLPFTHKLLAVGAKKSVDFYETTNYTVVHRLPREAQVSALQWLPLNSNGIDNNHNDATPNLRRNLLAVGDLKGNVALLQIEEEVMEMYGPTIVHQFQVQDQIRAIDLDFTCNSFLLAVGDKGGIVTFSMYTNTPQPQPIQVYQAHQVENDRILSLSFHPAHRHIALTTMGGDAIVYQVHQDKQGLLNFESQQPLFQHQRRGAVRSVVFSPQGDFCAFGGYDKTVVIMNTTVWAVVRELKLDGTINTMEFDPHDRYLAIGTRDKSFVLIDTSTFFPIKVFNTPGWVTSISWGSRNTYQDLVAVRSERSFVSLLDLTPISHTPFTFDTNEDGTTTEAAISWSRNGRFCARLEGSTVVVADAHKFFRDAATFDVEGTTLRGVAFCPAETLENYLALVGLDGHLTVLKLQTAMSGYTLEVVKAIFVEENLWVVTWAKDGSYLATGGRGKVLHVYSTDEWDHMIDPIKVDGRIWGIDFCNASTSSDVCGNNRIDSLATSPKSKSDINRTDEDGPNMAVASGSDVAIIFDGAFQPILHVHRPRTARSLQNHPTLPHLAIGDGAGFVAIVDYEEEETLKEFRAGSRVNVVSFSPKGDILVVGTDECEFTVFETTSYAPVQVIKCQGFGMVASFSPNGQCLALGTSEGIYTIIRLGPLLGVDLVPLDLQGGVEQLPSWALNEVLYRSGDGPSFVQRHMRKGDPDNLQRVAKILKDHTEAVYAFDRKAGEGCFDTALLLRKPNLLKLAVIAIVDGNLKLDSDAIMTSHIPKQCRAALEEIIENYHPSLVVDILREMTFVKVPFSSPRIVKKKQCLERGSDDYMDPWPRKNKKAIDSDWDGGAQMLTPALLPLPGLGRMEFLSSLLEKAPPTVFDNDAMAIVLRVLWKDHIKKYFIFDFCVYLLFYILWIVLVDLNFASGAPNEAQLGIAISVFVLNSVFALKELVQSDFGRRKGYITSIWNIVDLLSLTCTWYYVIADSFLGHMDRFRAPLAVVTSLLLTMKLVAYLRGMSDTGWLVSVLVQNLKDVRGFLVVLFVLLVGYTTSFRILFGNIGGQCQVELGDGDALQDSCEADPYGSYIRAFVSTFGMLILGDYEASILYESEYTALSIIIFIVATTGVLIVALNALIAVLADSYARVQENAAANRRKERAELIVEYMSILPSRKRRSIERRTTWFHALLQADDDGDLLLGKEDWQGGLNALRKEMEELIHSTSEQNQKALDLFKTEIDAEISSFRKEVTSLLEDMAGDIRSIRRLQNHDGINLNGRNVARAVKAVKSIGRRGQKALFGQNNK